MASTPPSPSCLDFLDVIQILAEPSDMAVLVTDAQIDDPGPHILYANPSFEKMSGYSLKEVTGSSPRMFQGRRTNQVELKKFNRALSSGEHARTRIVNYRKSGTEYVCDIAAWPITGQEGQIIYYLALEKEIERRVGRPRQDAMEAPWWLEKLTT